MPGVIMKGCPKAPHLKKENGPIESEQEKTSKTAFAGVGEHGDGGKKDQFTGKKT